MRRFFSHLRKLLRWLAEAAEFGLLVVVLAAALVGIWLFPSEENVRSVGLGLQVLGVLIAIRGVLKVRAFFARKTLLKTFRDWWSRRPQWRGGDVADLKSTFEIRDFVSSSIGMKPDRPKAPMGERVTIIHDNLQRIYRELWRLSYDMVDLRESDKEFEERIKQIPASLSKEIRKEHAEVHSKGFLLSVAGLFWVLFGIVLSTYPAELAAVAIRLRLTAV